MQELNGKADMMRFEILLEHGGIAVDADEECLRPLDDFPLLDSPYKRGFREHEAWAAYENETCRPELVAMGALGAAPGASVFEELVVGVANQDFRAPAWISVGPWYLTKAARRHPELFVYPARSFYPEHADGTLAPGDFPIFGRQHWGGTRNCWAKLLETGERRARN